MRSRCEAGSASVGEALPTKAKRKAARGERSISPTLRSSRRPAGDGMRILEAQLTRCKGLPVNLRPARKWRSGGLAKQRDEAEACATQVAARCAAATLVCRRRERRRAGGVPARRRSLAVEQDPFPREVAVERALLDGDAHRLITSAEPLDSGRREPPALGPGAASNMKKTAPSSSYASRGALRELSPPRPFAGGG